MGGIWNTITGKDKRRQKRHYNEALSQYNAYASEAQNTIDNLSRQLQQSMGTLQSLEQQKYYHSLKGHELQSHVSNYQNTLGNLERQKESLNQESQKLQEAFNVFKNKAPTLESRISDIEKLPDIFQNFYDAISKQKDSLKGLTEEEAAIQIRKYQQDVENLKKQRADTENRIHQGIEIIGREHKGLTIDKTNLKSALKSYQLQQDRLLHESNNLNDAKNQLEKIIKNYKTEQDRLTNAYSNQQNYVTGRQKHLQDYITNAQNELNSLGHHLEWRAGKYKKAANITGIAQGLGLAALTFGAGSGLGAFGSQGGILSSIGSGLKSIAPLIGIGHYMHTANSGKDIGSYQPADLNSYNTSFPDLSQIARTGLGLPKVAIPELGGLKQSLEHFNMPIVPKLKDLPQLHEALGKIVSLQDIESLSLGLPQMTSASGKKYSNEVLYNPEFIKKLKKMSKGLGMPYFKSNLQSLNPRFTTTSTAYA